MLPQHMADYFSTTDPIDDLAVSLQCLFAASVAKGSIQLVFVNVFPVFHCTILMSEFSPRSPLTDLPRQFLTNV